MKNDHMTAGATYTPSVGCHMMTAMWCARAWEIQPRTRGREDRGDNSSWSVRRGHHGVHCQASGCSGRTNNWSVHYVA